MKKRILRTVAFTLAALLTGGVMMPLSASAAGSVNVSSTAVTVIHLADSCSDFAWNGKSDAKIYIEKDLCPQPYFDNVRTGDTISVSLTVGAAGTYQVCLVTGWAEGVAGGNFELLLDGEVCGTLVNRVAGAGWRTWQDTTAVSVDLPAGTHTFTIRSRADGPNVEGLKLAPENVTISEKSGFTPLYAGGQGAAIEVQNTLCVQFKSALPITEVQAVCPSYNNNKGSFRLSLFAWSSSYEETLRGTPVASVECIDFRDNETLVLKAEPYADAGEYLFCVENIGPMGEQVGVWGGEGKVDNVRVFRDDMTIDMSVRVTIKYLGEENSLLPLSPLSGNDVDPTPADLYPSGPFVRRSMSAADVYGVRFDSSSSFTGAEVWIPAAPSEAEGNTLTLALYEWKGSWQKTVTNGQPLVSRKVDGVRRAEWVTLDTGELPAGPYLFVVSGGVTNMQVSLVEAGREDTRLYINGSACDLSLVARLVGSDGKLKPLSADEPAEFVNPGVWTAVDGLGRTVTDASAAGGTRDRFVGIFYHTWHASHYRNKTINANTVIEEHPDAIHDYNHPAWQGITTIFWDEPIWGYYNNGVDDWVLRNQAELLADADIDVVIFDDTNGTENYMLCVLELLRVWSEARQDGVRTPGISGMLNMFDYKDAAVQIREYYDKIYSKGLYRDLWFCWDGKPLMVGCPSGLDLSDPRDKEIYDFFSWRPINPCYTKDYRQLLENGVVTTSWSPESGLLRKYTFWKWISVYPQQSMKLVTDKSVVEEMSVSVAQNWSDAKGLTAMNAGLSNQYGRAFDIRTGELDPTEDAILWGRNFNDQFEYALEVDPSFIYVTGWNEWVAGRYAEMWGTTNALPDNATAGFSRDIEPSNGVLKDHYYYQMVSFIRRYKGVTPQEPAAGAGTIDITAGAAQWESVGPTFRSYAHNVGARNADGYQGYHYENTTGRNDLVSAKVSYDENNVYFMVTTADALTSPSDQDWMRLFIAVDGSTAPAWESFGFVVNRTSPGERALLERSTGGWAWERVCDVDYTVSGNLLQVAVPRAALGVADGDFTIHFKWADNNITDGDIMSVYNDGDAAPCGRFRFTYTSVIPEPETTPDTDPVTEPVTDPATEPETRDADTSAPSEDTADTQAPETDAPASSGCKSLLPGLLPLALTLLAAALCLASRRKRRC